MASLLPRLTAWDDSLFETVVATATNGVVVVNDEGQIRVFNSACEEMFQFRREEVLGKDVFLLLAPGYHDDFACSLASVQRTGVTHPGRELRGQRQDGTSFPIFLSLGVGIRQGRRMFVGIIQDLTSLQLERAMHAQERAFLAAIVESSNDAIISKTLDGKVTSWNAAAEKLFGYPAAEMIGTAILRLFPDDRLHEEAEILGKIKSGAAVSRYETIRLRKDGTPMDVSVTVSPIRDAAGRVIGASKTVRDISERKQAEARLQALSSDLNHVARLSEMGQVSAAMAHELNQPLTAVLNYTNLAKRLIAGDAPSEKTAEAVAKAGEQALRAGQIIRRLRDFVEKRESTRTIEDINAVMEDAMALGLIGTKTFGITTDSDLAEDLPSVLIDRVQIQQVLVNLIRNAAEAMATTAQRSLIIRTALQEDRNVQVSVSDTGTGIQEEISGRLFEPFVTTKPGGMGIGLAISRTIVESHGGRLLMLPNPGGGTIFQFTLPSVAA